MTSPTLVVLAAGMGSRYGGIKQIEGVGPNNESLIDYSIYNALKAGFKKIVLIIREEIQEDVKDFFKGKIPSTIPVEWVFQELSMVPDNFSVPKNRIKPWGTGHALLLAKDVVHEPFAMINGDDYYAYESLQKISSFLSNSDLSVPYYAVAGYELQQTLSPHGSVSRGVCQIDAHNNLISLEEHKKIFIDSKSNQIMSEFENKTPKYAELTGKEPVSLNLFGFTPVFFRQLEKGFVKFLQNYGQEEKSEFFVPTFLDELVIHNQVIVKVLHTNSQWFGITYKEDKHMVQTILKSLVENKKYSSPLWT